MNPRDLERIQFVTGHFHALQGLRKVVSGLMFLMLGTIVTFSPALRVALIVLTCAPLVWLARRLDSYYPSRFGEVERQAPINPLNPRGKLVVVVLALAVACFYLSMSLFSPAVVTPFVILRVFCFILGAWSIRTWWQRGSSRWQAHYVVLGVLLLGLVAPVDATRSILLVWSRGELEGGVFPLAGAYMAVTGLLDHQVLVRTMGLLAAPSRTLRTLAGAAQAEAPR